MAYKQNKLDVFVHSRHLGSWQIYHLGLALAPKHSDEFSIEDYKPQLIRWSLWSEFWRINLVLSESSRTSVLLIVADFSKDVFTNPSISIQIHLISTCLASIYSFSRLFTHIF